MATRVLHLTELHPFFCFFRFYKLTSPTSDRRQQLEASLKFQQFSREVEEAMQWISEHRPPAESSDYGKSLVGVQSLQKKHQALLNAITNYEGNVQSIDQAARELLSCDHFAANSIESLNADLRQNWRELKLLSAGRNAKLTDALEVQMVCMHIYHMEHVISEPTCLLVELQFYKFIMCVCMCVSVRVLVMYLW